MEFPISTVPPLIQLRVTRSDQVEPLKAELLGGRGSSQARGRMDPLAGRANTSSASRKCHHSRLFYYSQGERIQMQERSLG
jgi:hypothetical protein